jgi:transcriptional regulator with XRE-family HTH domain
VFVLNTFGELIKSYREKKNLTLTEVGLSVGISHSHLSRIESGERNPPKAPVLSKLSKVLDVPYGDLMIAAGYWDKDTQDTTVLSSIYYDEQVLLNEICLLLKKITTDENLFIAKYHPEIFNIFGGYADDNEVYERSPFQNSHAFDKWYKEFLEKEDDEKSLSDERDAVEGFNTFYNYRTIKKGLQNLDRFIVLKKDLDVFWKELLEFCSHHQIEHSKYLIKESPSSYSAEKELFDRSLDLSDKEIKERYDLKIDGRELTEDEYLRMIATVRFERQLKGSE